MFVQMFSEKLKEKVFHKIFYHYGPCMSLDNTQWLCIHVLVDVVH